MAGEKFYFYAEKSERGKTVRVLKYKKGNDFFRERIVSGEETQEQLDLISLYDENGIDENTKLEKEKGEFPMVGHKPEKHDK